MSMKKVGTSPQDLPGKGSLGARTAGKLVAPHQGSISVSREMFTAQRNTGPARRGAGGLQSPRTPEHGREEHMRKAEPGGVTQVSGMLMGKQRLLHAGAPQAE